MTGDDLAALGRDIENKVLPRAAQWHCQTPHFGERQADSGVLLRLQMQLCLRH
jgi:hypothetical protein